MAKVRIELNGSGVRELLKEVGKTKCKEVAETVAGRCGEGYIAELRHYPERTAAIVKANCVASYYDNLENNTIMKALGG